MCVAVEEEKTSKQRDEKLQGNRTEAEEEEDTVPHFAILLAKRKDCRRGEICGFPSR